MLKVFVANLFLVLINIQIVKCYLFINFSFIVSLIYLYARPLITF